MNDNDHEFRFVDYSDRYSDFNEPLSDQGFIEFEKLVEERLKQATEQNMRMLDFEPTKILSLARKQFQSTTGVDNFFNNQLLPFFKTFCENPQDPIYKKSSDIARDMKLFAMRNMTIKSKKMMASLGSIGVEEKENYPLTAVKYYLDNVGLDHVLMGMRKKEYIDDLGKEFIAQ